MVGVIIHANLTSQILSPAIDSRPQIKPWSEFEEGLWILLWSIIGCLLFWQQCQNIFLITVSFVLTSNALIVCCFLVFLAGWWMPLIPPILALVVSTVIITQYIFQSAVNMQKTFGRDLTDEVVTNLIEMPSGLKLGGQRRKVRILVSDVIGFSAIYKKYSPQQVVGILNLYLEVMTDVINQYKGTINDFMGDGIFVMFGAPISQS
jgi:adenylate cyclase